MKFEMTNRRRILGNVLVSLVRSDPSKVLLPKLTACQQDQLVSAAIYHRLHPMLFLAVQAQPQALAHAYPALRQAHIASVARQLAAVSSLARTAEALGAVDVQWLCFKGPVLSEIAYGCQDLRPYTDIDILVRAADFGRATAALEAAGCKVLDQNWTLIRQRMLGEIHLVTPEATVIDLHWQLVNEAREMPYFRLPAAALLNRRLQMRIAGLDIPTLDPTDMLIHTAFHACISGGERLGWMADIAGVSENLPINWVDAVTRAEEWQLLLVLQGMLLRAARCTNARSLSQAALKFGGRLTPYLWGWAALDTLLPPWTAGGPRSSARVLAKSTRGGSAQSTVALMRHLSRSRSPQHLDARRHSVTHSAGELNDRPSFFAAVAEDES